MPDHTVFFVRPPKGGWQCVEAPGVRPFWLGSDAKQNAIDYVLNCRITHRHGEIQVVDRDGNQIETIPFDGRQNINALG